MARQLGHRAAELELNVEDLQVGHWRERKVFNFDPGGEVGTYSVVKLAHIVWWSWPL
jgi:hypothetical protein